MKIVFMGTPDFAAIALKALIAQHEIRAVITQPDKPVGRGKKLKSPPVKEVAIERDIPIYQPKRIKAKDFVKNLAEIPADIFVVAAYGQLLSKEILELPKFGAVNIHASLLPKYRGAAPIQRAIIEGETETGITIMQMEEGLDSGPMILKVPTVIEKDETGESLHNKLAELGGSAILEALALIESGKVQPQVQDNTKSTYAAMLKKETGLIDWNKTANEIDRLVRGLYPWPGAYSSLSGFGSVKIIKSAVVSYNSNDEPGTVIDIDKKKGLIVACGSSALLVEKIQVSGKKAMDVPVFLLGNDIKVGQKFN